MNHHRRAITLIELLAVVAVITVLVAILFPAIQYAREAARRLQCASNLKQIGVALQSYQASHGVFPFGLEEPADPPRFVAYSAHAMLLPYLEQSGVYNALNLHLPALFYVAVPGAMANTTAQNLQLTIFFCPSETRPFKFGFPDWHPFFRVEPGENNYVACMGAGMHPMLAPSLPPPNGLFFNSSSVRLGDIRDGASHTAAFSETITGTGGDPMTQAVDLRRDTQRSPTPRDAKTPDEFLAECAQYTPADIMASRTLERGNTWLEGAPFRTLYNHVTTPNPAHADCGLEGDIWLGGIFAARSLHAGGVNLMLADGSVRFVSNSVDLAVWRSLGTRNGAESLSGTEY
jgi:prepilin-type processing-associated H-X9-DG protein